jgi:ketosteroid isomerase-like protein
MWRFTVVFLVVAVACAYGFQQAAAPDADKAAVKVVLDNYIASIEKEDLELYAKNVSHDTTMVNFGAFGPPITGWAALKGVIAGQNESLSQTKITSSDESIHVAPSGQFAWATCLWDFSATMGEAPVQLPVRCTWILEKRNGKWVIVHFHKSVAAG